ncbi:MAG: methyltransferase domain-containing protein [Verrucomicrobiota bacterium]
MTEDPDPSEFKELLKTRLFTTITAQIEQIALAPVDLYHYIGHQDPELLKLPDFDPTAMAATNEQPVNQRLNAVYDTLIDAPTIAGFKLNEDSDYWNIGYWDDTTTSIQAACENLQDKLLDLMADRTGTILDVACGIGASTRRLLNRYAPEDVWAINISEKQIEKTKQNAEGCNAQVMDATELKFEGEFFDNILCIEAAFHFDTRRDFLKEAYRVLKPGGTLALSDLLTSSEERLDRESMLSSAANYIRDGEEYEELLKEVGFRNVVVRDETASTSRARTLYMLNRLHGAFLDGNLGLVELTDMVWYYYHFNAMFRTCLFAGGQK